MATIRSCIFGALDVNQLRTVVLVALLVEVQYRLSEIISFETRFDLDAV